MTVALEVQHGIYHMFQHTRTGHITVFCHMTDDKDRNSHSLCNLHQHIRRFPDLGYTARRGADLFVVHGLNRVDDGNLRLLFFHDGADDVKIRLTEQGQIFIKFSDPHGAQFDLAQGLLAGNV